MEVNIIVECPHCKNLVEIIQLNCRIFRHAVDANFIQLSPHAPKEICEKQTVYGCGKPFRINENNEAVKCDYI